MFGTKIQNQQVSGQANYKRAAPIFHNEEHKMHMLIVAMDYKRTGRPLSCTTDAKNVEELARQSGVQWLVPLYDEQCTKEAVLRAIRSMGQKCGPDDYFIFYFAGHGTNTVDAQAADEVDGHDEAFVCVDKNGQVSPATLLSDSEFCAAVLSSCQLETRILIISDCCHTGIITDLSKNCWEGRQAIAVGGCQDVHVAEETGREGIFTHSMLLAIDKLSKVGRDNYSVGMLFNATLHEDDVVFSSKQDITIQISPAFATDAMAWPLVPPVGYQAPLNRRGGPGGKGRSAEMDGVSPEMMLHVRQESLNVPVSIEEYVTHVQGGTLFQLKPCRACTAGGCAVGGCHVQ